MIFVTLRLVLQFSGINNFIKQWKNETGKQP